MIPPVHSPAVIVPKQTILTGPKGIVTSWDFKLAVGADCPAASLCPAMPSEAENPIPTLHDVLEGLQNKFAVFHDMTVHDHVKTAIDIIA